MLVLLIETIKYRKKNLNYKIMPGRRELNSITSPSMNSTHASLSRESFLNSSALISVELAFPKSGATNKHHH